MSHLTGDIYTFKNLYLIEKKYSHRRNNFPAGNIENSYRQYISFGRKVFPLGILSKQVVIKKKRLPTGFKSQTAVLFKSHRNLNSFRKFLNPVGNSKYRNNCFTYWKIYFPVGIYF